VPYIGLMTSTSFKLGKLVAALFMALALSLAGLTPGHGVAGEPDHGIWKSNDSPCAKSLSHHGHVQVEAAADIDGNPATGDCCDGTFCAGETVRETGMTLFGVVYEVAFLQLPSDALKRADLTLPHRPPRTL
jgi:hypothetical protein